MRRLILAALALLIGPTLAAAETVTGTVTYLQRMLLPEGAVLEVVLQDVSLADAPAKTLATYRIEAPGAPPYRFAVDYDPAEIDPANTYSLRAAVTLDGTLMMTTDTAYPVLTRGAGTTAEMVLRMVAAPGDGKPDSDFVNTYWKIVTLGGEDMAAADGRREPHLILRTDGTYNATVGCNMIRGGYEQSDAKITFHPGAMTMMACPPPLDGLERRLTQTLSAAAGFAISGETMELRDATGATLATFRAVYF